MHHLIFVWFNLLKAWGYWGVVVLMAMESSIFPVPSEVVIPPAAFWAAQGHMNKWGVILAGTLGSWIGSAITYWLAAWLGRILVVRWGKWFFISEEKLKRAEHFVHRYEAGGVFFARLLPVIRHLISIPAGLIKMSFGLFSAMTIIGSFIWCFVLAELGERVAKTSPDLIENPEALVRQVKGQSMTIVLFAVLFCALYILAMRLTRPPAAPADEA
jgi:membrane protein DedA with SNARE-associated domain